MVRTLRRSLLIACIAALGACASTQDDYPSLAIRDVERAEGQFEPVEVDPLDIPPVPVPAAADGNLASQLAALVASARRSHAAFEEAVPDTRNRVNEGAGAAVGSNSWGAAQIALAGLESARSDSAVVLGDLDTLHIAATLSAEERESITLARAEVLQLIAEEDEVLSILRNMMPK